MIFCSPKNVAFILAGRTTGSGYSIYNYHYRMLTNPDTGVWRGGQRLIVFRGNRYVGQYKLNTPPFVAIRVKGSYVVLRSTEAPRNVSLDFSRKPPRQIQVNGEDEDFFR